MFKLYVASTEIESGTIPISWCVSKDKLKELARHGVEDPQVILCVVPEEHYHPTKEYRKVVPLKDLMTYVEFRHPGKNKIYGVMSFKYKEGARNDYLSKTYRRGYDTDMLSVDGEDWKPAWRGVTHKHSVSVDVPSDCFAPEPLAWEKAWVNHHFKLKCTDQCHFRKRRMFAYTVQPIMMVFNLVFRLLVLTLAVLVGARNLREWKRAFKPLTYEWTHLFEMFKGGTIFVLKPKTEEPHNIWAFLWWSAKSIWPIVFMPLLTVPLLILAWANAGAALTVLYVIGLALLIIVFVIIAGVLVFSTIKRRTKKRVKQFWYTEMEHLVCDGTSKPTSVSKLPRKHRTIKLRLSELKAMVCRPFAG